MWLEKENYEVEREKQTCNSFIHGGSHRSTETWKRVFTDWKCAVRKRARIIKASAGQTGGGPPEKPLTNLEDTLLSLLERVAVEGMADTSELGVVDIDYKKYVLL
ncbi:hypothetical protein ILUMI_12006 [Ignelater luminosus]|uniref:Regulatory protein zeste n=1 Tax=Ignelater luminosus TaxID=2038154 RepID=A0A8K0CUZ7_IGNLU|nr:hypothetical protein ILUMI_12006 [Ignelater luminosus]